MSRAKSKGYGLTHHPNTSRSTVGRASRGRLRFQRDISGRQCHPDAECVDVSAGTPAPFGRVAVRRAAKARVRVSLELIPPIAVHWPKAVLDSRTGRTSPDRRAADEVQRSPVLSTSIARGRRASFPRFREPFMTCARSAASLEIPPRVKKHRREENVSELLNAIRCVTWWDTLDRRPGEWVHEVVRS